MRISFHQARYLLLALLVMAQGCLAAHSAEYGAGPHSHGEIVCPLGVGNDDDPVIAHAVELCQAVRADHRFEPDVSNDIDNCRRTLPPPATGPPAHT